MPRSPIVAKTRCVISRRSLMKVGLGVSATGFLLRGITRPALAEMKFPTLGTFPAGVSANQVFVGGVMPLTGPYSSSGRDMQLGFELAVDHINQWQPGNRTNFDAEKGKRCPRQEDRISGCR